jgi:excisionase family DNA binding protein
MSANLVVQPTLEPRLLKVREAALLINFSVSKVYEMIARKEIPFVRLAGVHPWSRRALRIPVAELMAWIAAHQHGTNIAKSPKPNA